MTTFHDILALLLAPYYLDYSATARVRNWADSLVIQDNIALYRVVLKALIVALHSTADKQGKATKASFEQSALWTLAGKRYGSQKDPIFEQLATELLRQISLCAETLALASGSEIPRYSDAVKKAGRALDKLMNLSVAQIEEIYRLYKLSDTNNALNQLIKSSHFTVDEVENLKYLRSLQNLAYGHRGLRKNAGTGTKHLPRVPTIHFESMELEEEEVEQGITDFSVTYERLDDDDSGEEPHENDQVCFLTVNFEKISDRYPDKTLTLPQLYAIGEQMARQKARANNFHQQDLRWLEPSVLAKIDYYLAGNSSLFNKALVLLPLFTGRRLSSLSNMVFGAEAYGVIRLATNSAKTKIQAYALPVCDYVDVPIPARWVDIFEEIRKQPASSLQQIWRSQKRQRSLLKSIDSELSESKLRHLLPLTLRLIPRYDALSSLLTDSITSTDLTRRHYFCLPAIDAQNAVTEAWGLVEHDLEDPKGVTTCLPQDGFIGSQNNPDPESIASWLSEQPVDDLHEIRQRLVSEGQFMAHRGVIDPQPELIIDSETIKGAVLNDKDRGGRKQMSRLVLLTNQQLLKLQTNDKRLVSLKHAASASSLGNGARAWDKDENKPLTPSRLRASTPELPGPANAARKIFASESHDLPAEYLAIHMGWLTHGAVPFSRYSTLSPLQLAWARGVSK